MFNFVFDRCVDGKPYPNLASLVDDQTGLGDSYPWIGPLRLMYFVKDHNYPYSVSYIDQPIPQHAFYPVGLGYFSHDIDYFSMMSGQVLDLVRRQKLTVLFYYHEGDGPHHQKRRLDQLCMTHKLPTDCYQFVSGNTMARELDGFVYFPDHELFYWRNSVVKDGQVMPGCQPHYRPRTRQFTALSRIHKWWRATVMTRLHQLKLLNSSYWSYNTITMSDDDSTGPLRFNPIQIWPFKGLEADTEQFVAGAPYSCDTLTSDNHNQHWQYVPEHYENAYCNLVLETFFDADATNCTFISEKTFKPIRHGQPFVVFGTPNTLTTLKELGYRTFDHAIDNSYDKHCDNTERFKRVVDVVDQLAKQDLHKWYSSCWEDVVHNQQLFLASKYDRLNSLHLNLISK